MEEGPVVHEAMACLLNLLEQRAALEKKKRGWEILLDDRERLGCLFAQTEALVFCHGVCRPFPYRAYKRPQKLAHALYEQLLLFLDRTVRFSYLYQEGVRKKVALFAMDTGEKLAEVQIGRLSRGPRVVHEEIVRFSRRY